MPCLPPGATIEQLDDQAAQRRVTEPALSPQDARDAVAALFEFPSWEEMRDAVKRRAVLNRCDLAQTHAEIERNPRWAMADLWGWCDHCFGVAPLSYVAMLRFDAPRLGLTGDLSGTGAMAKLLLEAGAPVDGNPGDKETPLMTAASYGDADVAQVLIDARAELDRLAASDSGGVPGGSALLHAAVFGMTDVLNALVNAGARVHSLVEAAAAGDIDAWLTPEATESDLVLALIMAADHERLAVIDQVLEAGAPIDAVDQHWRRHPLRLAAQNGRAQSVRHLLARGADPTLTDDDGLTALELCGPDHRYLPGPGHEQVAAILTPLTS